MGLKRYREFFSAGKPKDLEDEVGERITAIAPNSFFRGTLTGQDTMRIAGRFEGTIDCKRLLWVESTGRVNGNIVAKRVINEGKIVGDIRSAEQVELRSNGRMIGDIHALNVTVAPGCHFEGEVRIIRPTGKDKKPPPESLESD
jgi:cytoskeletal protein CcmA (bactofilin family)